MTLIEDLNVAVGSRRCAASTAFEVYILAVEWTMILVGRLPAGKVFLGILLPC